MPSVGVLELIASTAALHNRLNAAFWAELAFKWQLYSVMPQAISLWARRKGCETYYATYLGLGRLEDSVPAGLDVLFISTPTQHSAIAYTVAAIHRARGTRVVIGGAHARAYPSDCLGHDDSRTRLQPWLSLRLRLLFRMEHALFRVRYRAHEA